jgi:hypothetical protein
MYKIVASGLTRDVHKEYGTIEGKNAFALFYNKAIYRFVYAIGTKNDVNRFLADFKSLNFKNCDFDETDGGENYIIEFFLEENPETRIDTRNFQGDGIVETESIEYDYSWLHSIRFEDGQEVIEFNVGNFENFINSDEGKLILEKLNSIE